MRTYHILWFINGMAMSHNIFEITSRLAQFDVQFLRNIRVVGNTELLNFWNYWITSKHILLCQWRGKKLDPIGINPESTTIESENNNNNATANGWRNPPISCSIRQFAIDDRLYNFSGIISLIRIVEIYFFYDVLIIGNARLWHPQTAYINHIGDLDNESIVSYWNLYLPIQ